MAVSTDDLQTVSEVGVVVAKHIHVFFYELHYQTVENVLLEIGSN